MALTKGATTLASSVTTTSTTSAVDVSNAYRASVYASMVQVGTATTPAQLKVEVSPDGGTTWYDLTEFTYPVAAGTYEHVIALPDDAQSVRLSFTAQSGGTSSTLNAQVGEITAL